MRSRYCAYVLKRRAYLMKTWHPATCPPLTDEHLSGTEWRRLDVLRSHAGFKKGWVEFVAHFTDEAGQPGQLHEVSEFHKVKNRWVYHSELETWPAE
jgi:SEC-C motif-containing protein